MSKANKKIKIVIAPDSFKGSISAQDAALAIEKGLRSSVKKGIELITVISPIADGGEGTLDALTSEDQRISVEVTSTNGKTVLAQYGAVGNTAIIEMARAAGLTLTPENERDASLATTFGVGELILDALDRGYRSIMLTVGGSGTNDGGCGMFSCLGALFSDEDKKSFVPTGATLDRICDIDISHLDKRLYGCEFIIATDVKNVLCGSTGATYVYGRQKGADNELLDKMEKGMIHYASLLKEKCGKDIASIEGCGAGGGLASPLLAFLNARIQSGIGAVLDTIGFDKLISDADAIITGEGKIDAQSLYGKAISGVTEAAKKYGVPVYCFVGCIDGNKNELLSLGIADIYTLSDIAPSVEYSIIHANELLEKLAKNFWESYKI